MYFSVSFTLTLQLPGYALTTPIEADERGSIDANQTANAILIPALMQSSLLSDYFQNI
jgi:hypothetical protein